VSDPKIGWRRCSSCGESVLEHDDTPDAEVVCVPCVTEALGPGGAE